MKQRIVELEIDLDGSVETKVTNVPGPACRALTKEMEAALGKVASRKNTVELTHSTRIVNQQQVKGG